MYALIFSVYQKEQKCLFMLIKTCFLELLLHEVFKTYLQTIRHRGQEHFKAI